MGVYIYVKLRESIEYKDKTGILPSSTFKVGLGDLIQNGLYNDDPIIPKN